MRIPGVLRHPCARSWSGAFCVLAENGSNANLAFDAAALLQMFRLLTVLAVLLAAAAHVAADVSFAALGNWGDRSATQVCLCVRCVALLRMCSRSFCL
jgi:hypothetical protein